MDNRIQLNKTVSKLIKKSLKCPKSIHKFFKFNGFLASGMFGDVYSTSIRLKPKTENLDLKKLKKTTKKADVIVKIAYASKQHVKESLLMKRISKLFYKTPHIPLFYTHYVCKKVSFRGYYGVAKNSYNWSRVTQGPGVITLMEYVGKSITHFLKTSTPHTEMTALFQVLFTLHVFEKEKIYHNDLYMSNLTFMTITDHPIQWKYTINNLDYYIPIKSGIPIIIDFGQSSVRKKYQDDFYIILYSWYYFTKSTKVKSFVKKIINKSLSDNTENLKSKTARFQIIETFFYPVFKKQNPTLPIDRCY